MTKRQLPSSLEGNRLRAAVSLLPIIASGLNDGKLPESQAMQMIAFCEWAMDFEATDSDEIELRAKLAVALERLSSRLAL